MPYNLEKCKIHQFDDVTGDYVTKMKKKKCINHTISRRIVE